MNRLRHHFRGSKANRDRRDQAFARAVIARVALLNQLEELPEKEHCIMCGEELPSSAPNDPYCSDRCAIDAELQSKEDM